MNAVEPPTLTLTGALDHPRTLTVAELRAWPQHRFEAAFACSRRGIRRHNFEGPLLHDVLRAAGPQFDLAVGRRDRVRYLLQATGEDGHLVVLSWGEIDPEFGNSPAFLATWVDGTPLDPTGPWLVLPHDHCGARDLSRLRQLRVTALPSTA